MTTRECVHLVSGSCFRSRSKDGGHAIRSTGAENVLGVFGDWIFTPRGSGFVLTRRFPWREYWMCVDLFCFCDLDLDPMTYIYELDPYSLEIHRMCIYGLFTSRLSKLSSDRQTDIHDRNYKPRRFVGCQ